MNLYDMTHSAWRIRHAGLWLSIVLMTANYAHATYPLETYPPDIREVGYPNTTIETITPSPTGTLAARQQPEPQVVTEYRQLLPILICESVMAKEDRHLVNSCHADAQTIRLVTQKGIELIQAIDESGENLYLGKKGKSHEIQNVLADSRITLVLSTLKNKRYTFDLILKEPINTDH